MILNGYPSSVAAEKQKDAVDWVAGSVTGTGYGTAEPSGNRTLDRIQAIRSAEISAYRALSEVINGVRIDSEKTMQDVMKDSVTKSRVEGLIRGAEKVSVDVKWEGEIPMATVVMKVCLNSNSRKCISEQSVVTALLNEDSPKAYAPKIDDFQPNISGTSVPKQGPPSTAYDSTRPVTGLILQLSPLVTFERSIFPVIVTIGEEGKKLCVYSAKNVKPEVIRTFGVIRYADTVEDALKDSRLGNNAMVIDVSSVTRENQFVIGTEGARLIRESTRYGNDYLADAKVVIAGK